MQSKRVNIYDRLPEIYRVKDDELSPPGQLKNFIGLFEDALSHINKNIEELYHDLFIETCRDSMIPYIGDLLGNSHLHGNTWTIRADTADTIALRRRKGTLIAIERLTFDLTQWGVHCRELRETLAWNQHLNHQRPDIGGEPPYGQQNFLKKDKQLRRQRSIIQGGTLDLREPRFLGLINTPFDPFAYTADLKIPIFGNIYRNLPNLAIFLWRIKVYQVTGSLPQMTREKYTSALDGEAREVVRVQVHPLNEPVRLFNTHRFSSTMDKPLLTPIHVLTRVDSTPAPLLRERLSDDSPIGDPQKYVKVTKYDETTLTSNISLKESNVALQLHVPQSTFDDKNWIFRGANLCLWEEGLKPKILNREIVIDPVIGRILIGVNTPEEGDALLNYLLLTYAYGSVGPVGAHPTSRFPLLKEESEDHTVKHVNLHNNETLQDALKNIDQFDSVTIEINDSMVHVFDISAISLNKFLQIKKSLVIKAADNQTPIIKLKYPLQFRPVDVSHASNLNVRLEGLYITRSDDSDDPLDSLISQVALNKLEIINCTLDPGGSEKLDGSISDHLTSIELDVSYGLPERLNDNNNNDVDKFNQTPMIYIRRSITGPIFIDGNYSLSILESIVDAGSKATNDDLSSIPIAISGKRKSPLESWGPPNTEINNTTIFGRTRVRSINGRGNIWKNTLEVLENHTGCIKLSYFSGNEDRLPQNYGCVNSSSAKLQFTSENFRNYAYAQLANQTDFRIKERGPGDNEMGAYGFLEDAHKWRNISIRFREFMPVGVKPLLIPVT